MQWNDSIYSANYEINQLEKDWETDGEIGKIKYMLDGHAGSNHRLKNGDASYLSKGTKLYAMKGKVQRVILQSDYDLSFVGEFSAKYAEQLVEELLLMPFEPEIRATEGKSVFFGMELKDGTMTRSLYWPDTGYINYGGLASQKAKEIFEAEMGKYD